MNNNLKRHEVILNKISNHFTIKNKEFSEWWNSQNDFCCFYLEETPNWKYAIRLEDENNFVIFGEHEELIDKFKPSCTYLDHENDVEGFIETVKNIAENPKLYFVDSMTYGNALESWVEHEWGEGDITYAGYQVIREYNEKTKLWDKFRRDESITQEDFVNKEYNEFYKSKLKRLEDEDFDKEYAFDYFKKLVNQNNIIAVGIKDMNKGGWRHTPRYYIYVVVSEDNFTQETFTDFYYELRKTIGENNYNNRKTYEHQFALEDCFDDLNDIKDCDYKYYKEISGVGML